MLFAGQTAWNNAKPILSQLVSDLTSNALNVVPLVTGAVSDLTQVLAGSVGKRDLAGLLLNQFGLGDVWTQVQNTGGLLVGQLTAILTQVLFSGIDNINLAKSILSKMAANIKGFLNIYKIDYFIECFKLLFNFRYPFKG